MARSPSRQEGSVKYLPKTRSAQRQFACEFRGEFRGEFLRLGVRPLFLAFWQLGQGRVAWKKRLRVLLLTRFGGACDDTSYGGVVQPQEASCLFVYVLVNVNCLVDLLVGDEIPTG